MFLPGKFLASKGLGEFLREVGFEVGPSLQDLVLGSLPGGQEVLRLSLLLCLAKWVCWMLTISLLSEATSLIRSLKSWQGFASAALSCTWASASNSTWQICRLASSSCFALWSCHHICNKNSSGKTLPCGKCGCVPSCRRQRWEAAVPPSCWLRRCSHSPMVNQMSCAL